MDGDSEQVGTGCTSMRTATDGDSEHVPRHNGVATPVLYGRHLTVGSLKEKVSGLSKDFATVAIKGRRKRRPFLFACGLGKEIAKKPKASYNISCVMAKYDGKVFGFYG